MDLLSYIIDKALVLIPVLYIIGTFLKKTPSVKDWSIPWILLAVGICGSAGLLGISIQAVIQGILVTGVTVLGHQLLKQTSARAEDD